MKFMATCNEDQINLTALQRIDSKIVELVGNASHICVYTFDLQRDEWIDIEIEGSLFIYRRSEIPYHGFVIMNRMNETNLVEPFVRGLEFKKQEPYLMYQNQSGSIYCTWFYELEDYLRVSALIQRIIHSKKGKARLERKRSSSESASMIDDSTGSAEVRDVISILTQAQKEYDKKNGVSSDDPVSSDDQPTSGINGYRSPLIPDPKLVDSTKSCKGNGYRENTQSRRRFLSGNEVTSTVIDEEAIVGQPTFIVGHRVQRHSENTHSSHFVTNDVLGRSPVLNDVQSNSAIPDNQAIMKKVDFRKETNDWIANHHATQLTTDFPSIPKKEYFHALSNHNGELAADVFHKNILLSSFLCMQNVPNSNHHSKVGCLGKCKKKLFENDNGLSTNLCHDNCTEQVKQSLFNLLQLETGLVRKIHNAHKSIQILQRNSRLHLCTSPEIHI